MELQPAPKRAAQAVAVLVVAGGLVLAPLATGPLIGVISMQPPLRWDSARWPLVALATGVTFVALGLELFSRSGGI
jgi:hypothetical protein